MTEAGFGIGAYTLTEAGKLLNVSPATIRRWLFGYSYDHHGPRTHQEPLWQPQYASLPDEPLLGFRDLIEARIVRGLRSLGIGLPTIRGCLRRASEIVGDSHPFSTRRFKTDGKRIFLEQINEHGDEYLIDLKILQHAFRKIVEPSFVDLDFDSDAASRWWLLHKRRTIVLDPARSFGQPIVAETGVPTARIAQAVEAEGSVERVAEIFDLSPLLVKDALTFEGQRTATKRAA
ncbi:MAG: DUF433 domain-containing protein [Sphingomonadaceae bacterium]|nr:DUF433 domain-containing protein [Sphingomonadaceae bacterium]